LVSRRHRPATALSWGSPVLRGLMCDRVVSFWTSDTGCATSCSRGRLPDHRSPNRAIRVHSALDLDPLQSSSPPPGRPTRRSDPTPLRFRRPTTTSPGRAPVGARTSTLAPVPPAGFHNLPVVSQQARVRGLVSCRCRPWATSPFRAFPRKDRCTPLGAACSLTVIPAHPACAVRGLITTGFADARAISDAFAGFPPRLWAPFRPTTHGWEVSRSPWTTHDGLTPDRTVHPLRSLDPLAKSAPPTSRVSP